MTEQMIKAMNTVNLVKDLLRDQTTYDLIMDAVRLIYDTNLHDARLFIEKIEEEYKDE